MPDVWVVPGFLSSELYRATNPRDLIWIDKPSLVLGLEGVLRLAPNGVDPGPPDGEPMVPGAPLPEWWTSSIFQLTNRLFVDGFFVIPFGWDFRKDIYAAGVELAARIRTRSTISTPATIAAHSAGGLVARAAWSDLVRTGDQGLVRRIVTLGSPHQGTYAPVMLMSGESSFTEDLLYWNNVLGLSITASPFTNPVIFWTAADLVELAGTWPALYELFPVLSSPNSSADPNRAVLLDRARWPRSVAIARAWLEHERDSFGPWTLSPQSFPPPWVMTTVGGTGYRTADTLERPELLGTPQAVGSTLDGDGLVTRSSAEISGSAVYTMTAPHSSLFIQAVNSGELVEWILDVRTAPSPPPPAETIAGITPYLIADPPAAGSFGSVGSASACASGKCPC